MFGWMRASKLRFPESTAATTRSCLEIVSLNSRARSPELPMQVVQPYPASAKPNCAAARAAPPFKVVGDDARARCNEVLICGLTRSPCATAFCARSPAAIMTAGLEVLVPEVIAAMRTSPLPKSTPSMPLSKRFRGPRNSD